MKVSDTENAAIQTETEKSDGIYETPVLRRLGAMHVVIGNCAGTGGDGGTGECSLS